MAETIMEESIRPEWWWGKPWRSALWQASALRTQWQQCQRGSSGPGGKFQQNWIMARRAMGLLYMIIVFLLSHCGSMHVTKKEVIEYFSENKIKKPKK